MNKDALVKSNFAANMARLNAATAAGTAVVWERTPLEPAAPEPLDNHSDAAYVRLALSGRVSPVALAEPVALATRQDALNEVVEQCVVEADSQQVRWLLKQPKRVEVLQTLIAAGQLADELAKPLPATDLFGEQLRALLRQGADVPAANLPADTLLALMEAMEATHPLGLPQPDWRPLRQQIGFQNFRADQRLLLSNGLVGRKKQLAQLHTLLTDQASPGPMPWRGLIVRGMGGSGKSTLLAQFIDDVLTSQTATLLLFDFDRPGINPTDTLGLESEMARQIGYQYPAISDQLRVERARSREVMQLGVQQASESSFMTDSRGTLSNIQYALTNQPTGKRPMLLLLDTFEEAVQQQATPRLLDWLRSVADQFWNVPVRVIFSGRLYPDDDEAQARFAPDSDLGQLQAFTGQPPLTLAELTRPEAKQLLKKLNVSAAASKRIVSLPPVARQPLALKLLARLVAEQGEGILTDIEKDVLSSGQQVRSLFMGLVYKRALERMNRTGNGPVDALTQQLAYPGLWLRYATTDLILHVLAPVLGLTMTPAEAQQALAQLTRYKWICYRQPDGRVWHRRDLRRAMLLAMRADQPDLARRLSEATIAYLTRQEATQAEPNPQAQAELLYHRLLWLLQPNDGASLNLAALKAAAEYIATDVVDLPKPAQALLDYAKKGRVNPKMVDWLPTRYVDSSYHRFGRSLINDREFGRALTFFHSQHPDNDAYVPDKDWEMELLFATARWDEFTRRVAPISHVDVETRLGTYQHIRALIEPRWSASQSIDSRTLTTELRRIQANKGHTERQQYAKHLTMHQLVQWRATGELAAERPVDWVRGIKNNTQLLSSAHFTRKLLYLELLVPGEPLSLTLAPSLLKLDPDWLDALMTQPWMASQPGDTGRLLRQRLLDARAKLRPNPVRRTLDALDALYRDRFDARVQGDMGTYVRRGDELLRWFRGPDSEFRDPTRFALLDVFQTGDDYRELARLISASLPVTVTDLEPEAFANAMQPDPEHGLEPYIELVDRAWALGTLLKKALAARPAANRLVSVKAAHQRWDAAVTAAFQQWNPDAIPTQS